MDPHTCVCVCVCVCVFVWWCERARSRVFRKNSYVSDFIKFAVMPVLFSLWRPAPFGVAAWWASHKHHSRCRCLNILACTCSSVCVALFGSRSRQQRRQAHESSRRRPLLRGVVLLVCWPGARVSPRRSARSAWPTIRPWPCLTRPNLPITTFGSILEYR